MSSTYLVTGSAGAIGSMVVRNLLNRGQNPVGYDFRPLKDSAGELTLESRFMKDIIGEFEYVQGDLLDLPRLMDTVKRLSVDHIIHTAALLPDLARANPYQAIRANIEGTANVVEVAKAFNVKRIVYTSTKGVLTDFTGEYGHPTYKPIKEDYPVISPNNSHTFYNDTKVFCEHYLHKCVEWWGLSIAILRFASIHGPGRLRHGGRAVMSAMIDNAMRGKPTIIPEGGEQKDDFLYIKDVANAIVLACLATDVHDRVFHIGSGRAMSYYEFAETIKGVFPGATIEIGPGLDPMKLNFLTYGVMDISRAREVLGYEPQYSLEEGIRDYWQIMKEVGLVS